MRIKDIETVACNVPFKNHMKFHSGERIGATRVIVKLQSDEGITGLGETQHFQSKYVIDNVLKPAMIGEDPTNIERLRAKALIGRHLTGSLNRCWENDPWSYSG